MVESNTVPLKVSTDLASTDTLLLNVGGVLSRVKISELLSTIGLQTSGAVLPTFSATTYPKGAVYTIVPTIVANQAARLVAGIVALNGYVYQTDTDITYQLTTEDGDEANDWTAITNKKRIVKYESDGTEWLINQNGTKKYIVALTQTGAAAPVVSAFENDLAITWVRSSASTYVGSGTFTAAKIVRHKTSIDDVAVVTIEDNTITIITMDGDDVLSSHILSMEISR